MKYAFMSLAAVFGLLHGIAALKEIRANAASHAMLLGSCTVIFGTILNLLCNSLDWVFALCGSLMVMAAAIKNGMIGGKIHIAHHLLRGAFALAFVIGFVFF